MLSNKYLKNRIGFIPPKDWNAVRLENIVDINQESLSPTKTDPELEINYIELSSIDEGSIEKPIRALKFENAPSRAKRVVHKGDVIMSTVRPYLKGFAIADQSVDNYICSTGFAVLTPKNGVDSEYIFQNLFTETFQRQFYQLTVGSSYPALNNSDVKKLVIPLPENHNERVKIGNIFSIWDKAISTLEDLIQAKKRYKKGLMQQLLTGQKRFPEFEGEDWREVQLNKIFNRITEKNENQAENILTISSKGGFLDQTNKFGEVIAGKNLENYTYIQLGDFAYNKGNSLTYPQGCIFKLEDYEHAAVPNVYYCFRPKNDSVYSDFYKYYFELGLLNHQLSKVINTGVRNDGLLNLKMADFFSSKVKYPSYKEQKKIAFAIDPVDKGIELLEQQLEVIKKQKKGLMQQLLTGKVRVNEELTKAESYG